MVDFAVKMVVTCIELSKILTIMKRIIVLFLALSWVVPLISQENEVFKVGTISTKRGEKVSGKLVVEAENINRFRKTVLCRTGIIATPQSNRF